MFIVKVILTFLLSVSCTVFCTEPYVEKQAGDLKQDNVEIVTTNCDFLFNGNSFPLPRANEGRGLVKLCQNQVKEDYVGPSVLATLYSTVERIPAYTANVVMLYPNSTELDRPDSHYWHRVALSLCGIDPDDKLPSNQIFSNLGSIADESVCRKYQATAQDYVGNNALIGIDRGHLSPNSINSQDMEKQIATFTLTNAAPQFSNFNRNAWREYECIIMLIINMNVPMERVYIITGTHDAAKNKQGEDWWMNEDQVSSKTDIKNPVLIPGYYWKAVCYPGNPWENKAAWSFAVMQKNSKDEKNSDVSNFMPIQEFSDKYFERDIFDKVCMNAKSMGPIEEMFKNWEEQIEKFCQRSWTTTKTDAEDKQEL